LKETVRAAADFFFEATLECPILRPALIFLQYLMKAGTLGYPKPRQGPDLLACEKSVILNACELLDGPRWQRPGSCGGRMRLDMCQLLANVVQPPVDLSALALYEEVDTVVLRFEDLEKGLAEGNLRCRALARN
jgi:hypothetical protein